MTDSRTMPTGFLLIVGNDAESINALRHALAADHPLQFAWTCRDAQAVLRRQQPALVLLDRDLPDGDGLGLCRALASEHATRHIPVIAVLGGGAEDAEAAAFEAGAADCIFKSASPVSVRARVRLHLSRGQQALLEASHREAILMLGKASHFRDDESGVHPWRMAAYAAALAGAAGWNEADCRLIGLAAALHDIGKLGIPDHVLLKPLKLDDGEWEIMKTHCRIGHEILRVNSAPVFRMGATIALHHHEKWDGSGYPDRLAGEHIPEAARITAIADVFDSLTVNRPFRKAWSVDAAMNSLRMGAGRAFDPRLVACFDVILPRILDIKAHWDATTSLPTQV